MFETKAYVIMWLFAWVPYAAVAWGYKVLTEGDAKTFWYALGALVAIRTFFSVIETIGNILAWRLYAKRATVQKTLTMLRAQKFPKRQFASDDFTGHLARVEDDPEYAEAVRRDAHDYKLALYTYEQLGILSGMRMNSAFEAAFDLYSPQSEAPTHQDVFKQHSDAAGFSVD